jgi:hypothetical protein
MRFCIRRDIDFGHFKDRLAKVHGVPIELALPTALDLFQTNRHVLLDIARHLREKSIAVRSVQAPQGRISDVAFRGWGSGVAGFAEAIGAEMIVFYPENIPGSERQSLVAAACENLTYVRERTKVTVAVETVSEEGRVLGPREIMDHALPMVLDTSLLSKPDITWIMESYHTHVVNVHLSAVVPHGETPSTSRKFQPIDSDPFCMDLLDRFSELGWDGLVTLEYMPWLTAKSLEDRNLLEQIYHQHAHDAVHES